MKQKEIPTHRHFGFRSPESDPRNSPLCGLSLRMTRVKNWSTSLWVYFIETCVNLLTIILNSAKLAGNIFSVYKEGLQPATPINYKLNLL